ncbi:MAG: 30S ribosomal protein S19 [Candidatus Altiarchaeota archaeon]|nr:30S ribosomal protein S19 [Candidatus Altiarchaeota archaeon]
MAKKKFTYKGHSLEELQAKSMDELVDILPARMRRSLKRGFTETQKKLIADIRKTRKELDEGKKAKPVRTQCRDMPILPEMIGMDFEVYNGKEFQKVTLQPEMIGQYLGEFTLSRKPVKHSAPGVGATRSSLFVPVK